MADLNKFCERNHKKLLFLCVIIVLIFSSFHFNDMLVADEVDYFQAGEAIAETGKPNFAMGLRYNLSFVWHPPLFQYILGFTFFIAGSGEAQARALTTTFMLLTILLIFYLALELFRKHNNRYLIGLTGAYIFALNPFMIQGSLLIDNDTSILTFAITGFIFLFIRNMGNLSTKKLLIFSLLFCVLLWIKLPTPPVIVFSIFIFYLLNREYKNAIKITSIIGIIGALAFLSTWWLTAASLGLDFNYPFNTGLDLIDLGLGFQSEKYNFAVLLFGRLKIISFWATPFLIFLGLYALRIRWLNFRKTKKVEPMDLLVIVTLMIFIEYTVIYSVCFYYPKYYSPMMPFLSIIVAYYICNTGFLLHNNPEKSRMKEKKNIDEQNKNRNINNDKRNINKILIIYGIVFVLFILLFLLFIGDPLLSRNYLNESLIAGGLYLLGTIIILIVFMMLLKFMNFHKISLSKIIFITLVLGLTANYLYVDTVQSNADYYTRFYYGETGQEAVIDFINSNTNSSEIIIAPKEIGYYIDSQYFRGHEVWMNDADLLNRTIEGNNIQFIIFRIDGHFVNIKDLPSESSEVILVQFNLIEDDNFGDYEIYMRKSQN